MFHAQILNCQRAGLNDNSVEDIRTVLFIYLYVNVLILMCFVFIFQRCSHWCSRQIWLYWTHAGLTERIYRVCLPCASWLYTFCMLTPPLSNFMNPQQSNYVASFINWLATLIVFHWYTAWRGFSFSDFTKRTKNIPYSLYFFTRLLENCDKGLVIWIPSLIFFN